jgi:hypothetical protein
MHKSAAHLSSPRHLELTRTLLEPGRPTICCGTLARLGSGGTTSGNTNHSPNLVPFISGPPVLFPCRADRLSLTTANIRLFCPPPAPVLGRCLWDDFRNALGRLFRSVAALPAHVPLTSVFETDRRSRAPASRSPSLPSPSAQGRRGAGACRGVL